jgi:hypothetical protein
MALLDRVVECDVIYFPSLRAVLWSAAALGLLCSPRTVQAQFYGPPRGTYILPGFTASTVVRDSGKVGGFLGGEVSLAHLGRTVYWYGGYVDAGYDFANKGARVTLGPELGCYFFGVDGGLLLEDHASRWQKGFVVRGFATVAIAAIYVRYGQILTGDRDLFFETGLLFKLPIPTGG